MPKRFATEAVMIAIYGQLLVPARPVEYLIPYSSVLELYDFKRDQEPLMPDPIEEAYVRQKIDDMIRFFDEPLNRKKLDRIMAVPWRKASLLVNDHVNLQIIHAVDQAQFGEAFDPIETELILSSARENVPILTDQIDFIDKVIDAEIAVQLFDIEDFEFALEDWEHIPGDASE